MEIIIGLVLAVVFSLACAPAMRKYPWLFYAIAVVLDILYLAHATYALSPQFDRLIFPYFQRGILAYGLFVVIMYIGVLPKGSAVRQRLLPARGELSIFAALLTIGHIVWYAGSYLSRALSGFAGMPVSQIVSFFIAVIITILLAILTVTSFNRVRQAMNPKTWKAVQKLAYAFFILVWVHLCVVLLPSAGTPFNKAFIGIAIYTVVTVVYVVLRIVRARADAAAPEE